jgi:O-antigen/teichoic acid export membrane protein
MQSTGARFAITFVSNIVRAAASFAGGAVVARSLGPEQYGELTYLLATFVSILPLLDGGTSSAFFTFLSQQKRGGRFLLLFAAWLTVQATIPLLLIAFIVPSAAVQMFWLTPNRTIVVMAFASAFLTTQLWGAISRLGEVRRQTLFVQSASATQALIHLMVVYALSRLEQLTVGTTLALLIIECAVLCVTVGGSLLHKGVPASNDESSRDILTAFWRYCKPLLLYTWIGVLYAFADRWMLQTFSGAAQQGHFSFASQFSAISLLATSSILNVFWKEVAEAISQGDTERVEKLHRSVTGTLFFSGALTSCALIPYTPELLRWTAGTQYEPAAPVLVLLLLYPVHQALGQLQGTFFYATSETKAFATIGTITMVLGIPLTYFLLAPNNGFLPGASLGANGLALKMVLLQFVSVTAQEWYIARQNAWPLMAGRQTVTLASLAGMSWLLKILVEPLVNGFMDPSRGSVVVFVVATTIFTAIGLAAAIRFPSLIGLSSVDVTRWTDSITQAVSKYHPRPRHSFL